MLRSLLLVTAAAGLGLSGALTLAAPARRAAPVQRDWSRTVVVTPEGGYRMGNPAARVKLVEYGSLTCGHCAHFAETGMAPLVANYVRGGKVSLEYRNYILNGLDIGAALLARCAVPSRFFPMVDRLYATQRSWMGRNGALTQAERERLRGLPENQRLGALAETVGLTAIAAQFGVPATKAKACLADQAAVDRLGAITDAGVALGVQGTPTFLINGANIGPQTWESLQPILSESVG